MLACEAIIHFFFGPVPRFVLAVFLFACFAFFCCFFISRATSVSARASSSVLTGMFEVDTVFDAFCAMLRHTHKHTHSHTLSHSLSLTHNCTEHARTGAEAVALSGVSPSQVHVLFDLFSISLRRPSLLWPRIACGRCDRRPFVTGGYSNCCGRHQNTRTARGAELGAWNQRPATQVTKFWGDLVSCQVMRCFRRLDRGLTISQPFPLLLWTRCGHA